MTSVARLPRSPLPPPLPDAVTQALSVAAGHALLAELETWPKPGLVSHIDKGSHTDMDAGTFRASVEATQPFYGTLAVAGAAGAGMDELRRIGLDAERAMMAATGGINTHRGAIFGLGLLCAAAGAAWHQPASRDGLGPSAAPLGPIVSRRWGPSIVRGPIPLRSHGTDALRQFGAGGARAQAAAGFPHAYQIGLPALRLGRALAPGDAEAARVQAFFALLASLEDTNLLHRGGGEGLQFARQSAAAFLTNGGVGQKDWRARASLVHQAFIERRLSPGGCADLLAIALFLDALGGQS